MHLKLKTIKIGPKQYPDNMVVDCAFTKKYRPCLKLHISYFCAYAFKSGNCSQFNKLNHKNVAKNFDVAGLDTFIKEISQMKKRIVHLKNKKLNAIENLCLFINFECV